MIQDPSKGGEAGESTEVAVRVRFDEDKDFEPPQGSLEIIEVSAAEGAYKISTSSAPDQRELEETPHPTSTLCGRLSSTCCVCEAPAPGSTCGLVLFARSAHTAVRGEKHA